MKIFLIFCLVSASVQAATLESFFTKLEGPWKSHSAETHRETPAGHITFSRATKFEASVTRAASRWSFAEDMCWSTEGEAPVCGKARVSYEVENDALFILMDDQKLPVEVMELDDEFLMIMLTTDDYVFTAILSVSGNELSQQSVTELNDGTKEYQFLELIKQ
jgi:hypothetical protein